MAEQLQMRIHGDPGLPVLVYLPGLGIGRVVRFPDRMGALQFARWWLRRNCPGYKDGKTFWAADHNVLGTAPHAAADQIQTWMAQ